MPTLEKYRQIAELFVWEHEKLGCMFAPTVIQDMAAAAMSASAERKSTIDAMVQVAGPAEIYCPHEGIDRRAEFGIA